MQAGADPQQLALGADGQIWFRWRTCTAGREQYWHGLLGHDGRPLRRYREAAQTAAEYHRLAPHLAGTTVHADVAFINDYASIWALQIQPGFEGNTYHAALQRYYDAFLRAGVNVDMVPPDADLSAYRIVVAADLHVLPDALAERLAAYVHGGGVLLADCRTGVKTETNLCHDRTLPGLLAAPLGITIEEYDVVPTELTYAIDGTLGACNAHQYVDWITPDGAAVLARYPDAWQLAEFAAVTRNRYGAGAGYYVGTVVQEPAFYDALIADLFATAGVTPLLTPPPGVEVSVRAGDDTTLLFLLNQTQEPKTVALPAGLRDLLAEADAGASVTLERFGVAVYALEKTPDAHHRLERTL